jgi:transcriptional repressor NrdR
MNCPFCRTADSKVIDSRLTADGRGIRRRRECPGCRNRFTTYEWVQESAPIVVKKDGRREPFDRNKLQEGLRRAFQKRPVSTGTLEDLVRTIERTLSEFPSPEIPSKRIGELVMDHLARIDHVAYVRFASVYKNFRDPEEFAQEITRLKHGSDFKPL